MQTDQVLLVGCESTPVWKQYIHSGAVPELISLELISLAEWLILFVWAACCSKMVMQLLDPSWFTSGQLGVCLHVAVEMCSQSSFYYYFFFLVSTLEVEVYLNHMKANNLLLNPQQGVQPAVLMQRERKESCLCRKTVDKEGGEQEDLV